MFRIYSYCASCLVSSIVKRYSDGWINNRFLYWSNRSEKKKIHFLWNMRHKPFSCLKEPWTQCSWPFSGNMKLLNDTWKRTRHTKPWLHLNLFFFIAPKRRKKHGKWPLLMRTLVCINKEVYIIKYRSSNRQNKST